MILVDTNLLIYAYNYPERQHKAALEWWEATMNGEETIGLPWVTIMAFLRVMTRPGILANPMTPHEAIGRVRTWIERPGVEIVNPGPEHARILFELIEEVGVAGNLTTDAQIAALALEWRAEVATTDTDFARFAKVRWFNPLRRKRT